MEASNWKTLALKQGEICLEEEASYMTVHSC